jgi:hypothetical protein
MRAAGDASPSSGPTDPIGEIATPSRLRRRTASGANHAPRPAAPYSHSPMSDLIELPTSVEYCIQLQVQLADEG